MAAICISIDDGAWCKNSDGSGIDPSCGRILVAVSGVIALTNNDGSTTSAGGAVGTTLSEEVDEFGRKNN